MRITFLEDRRLAEHGKLTRYAKGDSPNVGQNAAAYAISQGWAAPTEEPDDMDTVVNKIIASLRLNGFPDVEVL